LAVIFNVSAPFHVTPCSSCWWGGSASLRASLEASLRRFYAIVNGACRIETWVWWMLLVVAILVLVFALWSALSRARGTTANTVRNAAGQWPGVLAAAIAVLLVLAICGYSDAVALVTWGVLLGIVLFVRRFLIQYVGDVAAYVSPHMVDRFFELRAKIKTQVWKVAHLVYALRASEGGEFLYDDVVVVGHSLGSVVVYDALNRLLNDDDLVAQNAATDRCCDGAPVEDLKVRERTRLLLTFGSPLDKTAFVFAMHDRGAGSERDALAASVQPLITMDNRFRWVNVWSPWDIISGPLNFYDTPQGDNDANSPRIDNCIDPAASTPLAAHVEYWDNPLIYWLILEAFGETR
jgi:hypothetical protein